MSSGRVAGDQWPRRDFLRGGLGAAGIAAATPLLAACSGDGGDRGGDGQAADPQPADPPVATGERIVIVGAGAAALAAADELQIRGFHNVVLLEARDRVGGRIWTSSIGDGIPVELGATWIHGVRGNPISDIVESNRIATAETDYDNAVLYDHDGRPAEPLEPALWGQYMALAYEMPEASLADVFERFAATHDLSDDDRRLWLHSLASMFSHEFGADISDLSILSYDGPSTFRGGDVVFPHGYSQIVDVLAAGRDIRLEHPVAGIDHSGPTVVVTTESGDRFEADRVVVTVPLGVLKAD
ncbi:MAG: NAD(P)-binding protein, partial [Acidimicrobiaceae bacterium]|nr:NAD(P)-binding protein [Acidimicrobiaceae bacterium]